MTGILDRVFDGIDDALGVSHIGQAPHHEHASSFTRVASGSVDWVSLVFRTAARLEANWDKQPSRDTGLWRLEPQERSGHQVPVCSGINGVTDDRSVDHVDREGGRLALIELTASADTPLRAAIELLVDGLLYRFARSHRHQLGLASPNAPGLDTTFERIALVALAPTSYRYYEPPHHEALAQIEDGLRTGLHALATPGYTIDFAFEHFELPSELASPGCCAAIAARGPVVPSK